MKSDTYVTLSGNLTAAPKTGHSRTGDTWARIRVASTSRIFDRVKNEWRDGETRFLDVTCWRRLAENVVATLDRGDLVLVYGRLHQRSFEDQQGVKRTNWEMEADAVGPDLSRSPAQVLRLRAPQDGEQDSEHDSEPAPDFAPEAEAAA